MHIHTHVHPIISQIFHPGCGSILIHSVKSSQKASPCGYLFVDSWYWGRLWPHYWRFDGQYLITSGPKMQKKPMWQPNISGFLSCGPCPANLPWIERPRKSKKPESHDQHNHIWGQVRSGTVRAFSTSSSLRCASFVACPDSAFLGSRFEAVRVCLPDPKRKVHRMINVGKNCRFWTV